MKPVIGIFLGEATGIGPEIVAKLCAESRLQQYCRPILIGDVRVLEMGIKIAGVSFPYIAASDVSQIDWSGPIAILDQKNLDPSTLKMGETNSHSGKVTGDTLINIMEMLKQGKIAGFVYAPLNKQALQRGGHKFPDDLHFFSYYLDRTELIGELNVLNNLWICRVTSHIPIGEVPANLNHDNILRAITLVYQTLIRAGYTRPRIAIAGLNPHCGEGGMCGREELDIIAPAAQAALQQGMEVMGPFSADAIFIKAFQGEYDAVVTMYHDQGHIAMKLMGTQSGVTAFGGMPYPIATPSHGTAFDIAGKGLARVDATEHAVCLVAKMAASQYMCPASV